MPTSDRRPRRRLMAADSDADFATDGEVRGACALLRAQFPTVADAEASLEWRAMHRRVTRWLLRTASALPVVGAEDHARRIALVYLRGARFLPALAPADADNAGLR